MKRLITGFWIVWCLVSAQAELWMPSVFNNGMVLQREQPVPVWGRAESGEEVTVEFAGQKKTAITDSSKHWKIVLDPLAASSEPRKMTVHSSSGDCRFSDVLVGDVWILAGQSNMGWTLSQSTGGAEAVAKADYPWLRFFMQDTRGGVCDVPADDVKDGQWVNCTPLTAGRISGVGFFFARALGPYLDGVPVALISTACGGTYTECWIDFQTLEKTPSARPFLDKVKKEILPGESADKNYYWGPNNYRRPAGLFNSNVAPLQPLAVRGVLWYQGEGNSQNWLAGGQEETLTALITSWRQGFEQPELPFLIIQLPRYNAGAGNNWPAVRAAQAQVAGKLPSVGVVVTIDCGEEKMIHPPNKQPVGERLALLARAKVYGQNVLFSGPVFQTLEKSGDALTVCFQYADGLFFKGGVAQGFEICGADKKFVPAQAEILPGGAVKVFSPDIKAPVAVRYGWFNWGEVSLFNGAGFPAAPFAAE